MKDIVRVLSAYSANIPKIPNEQRVLSRLTEGKYESLTDHDILFLSISQPVMSILSICQGMAVLTSHSRLPLFPLPIETFPTTPSGPSSTWVMKQLNRKGAAIIFKFTMPTNGEQERDGQALLGSFCETSKETLTEMVYSSLHRGHTIFSDFWKISP